MEAALKTPSTYTDNECEHACSPLQRRNTAVIEPHAKEVIFTRQDADALEGEWDVHSGAQEETVQEDGLLHTAPHHVQRDAGGLR